MDQINQMTTFVKVVERRGFAAASRDLGIAPSIVTSRIQALEQRLSARLFNRNTRRTHLTEVGEAYFQLCTDLLRRFDAAHDLVASMQSIPKGVLRLNLSFLLSSLVTPVISEYTKRYPDVSVQMIVTGRMVDLFDEHYDVAICHKIPPRDGLVVRKLAGFRYLVCGSPAYFKDRPAPQTPSDLINHNCLICTDSDEGDRWPIFGASNDIALKGNLHSNDMTTLVQAAINGQGLAVAPHFAVEEALKTGQLVSVLSEHIKSEFPIATVYPHRGFLPIKVGIFIDLVARSLRANSIFSDKFGLWNSAA